VNTETISRKKKEDYQRFTLYPGNEGSKHHRQSTGGCVRLAPTTSSQDFKAASSFWATLFIARVSTCCTQQVWGKVWMQRLYSGLGCKHLAFSWSNFISTWLLIKYKFIPTHIKHKEVDKIRHCETWVPLGPHRLGSRPSPTSGSGLLEDPPTCQWTQPT
jgi:hypothetical protein